MLYFRGNFESVMKTPDQIYRHVTHCKFTEKDWERVKAFCNNMKIRTARHPISTSTFDEFVDWYENGYGSGDLVKYGNTVGIVGDDVPAYVNKEDKNAQPTRLIYLVAFLDYNKEVFINDLDIRDPQRVERLNEEESQEWKQKFFEAGLDYDIKEAHVMEIPKLKRGLYYKFPFSEGTNFQMGMLEDVRYGKYHFSCYSDNGKILTDHWVDINNVPLRSATLKDIERFHNQLGRSGFILDPQKGIYVKKPTRNGSMYWYVDELFRVCAAKNDGSKKHENRWLAGNYFADIAKAQAFVDRIIKIKEEEN